MSIKRTIITTIVALALVAVVAPAVTQADQLSDLMAQITALTAQLNALQAGSAAAPASTGACAGVTFTRTLNIGSTGQDVKCLQQIVGNTITGTFGPATLAKVKAYQRANGITASGNVGPLTRAKLNAAIAGTVTPGQPVVTPTGAVSATLALDTPAAGAIVGGQAQADLLHINFTGTGTVTSVTLQRSGISDANLFASVYLYDGNTRITGGYSFNSNSSLTMNGLSIAVNGSHVISVRGDVSTTGSENDAVVTLVGFMANGSTTSANVRGNDMTVASANLATAKMTGTIATASPAAATVNSGTVNQTLWSRSINISPRSVLLYGMTVKMVGSAPSNSIANVGLFVDGTQVRSAAINSNMQFVFDAASNPITLTTGSHVVEVRGDIVSGSSRDFYLSLEQGSDISVKDSQLGVFLTTTDNSSASISNVNGGKVTINGATGGSVTVTQDTAFSGTTTLVGGASNVTMASFKFTAYGEDEKITELDFLPSISGTDSNSASATTLTNVGLYVNGAQVGSNNTATHNTALKFTNLGSNLIVPAGQSVIVTIKGDVIDSNGYAYTVGASEFDITSVANNAQGQSSNQMITTGTASGQSLTISSASTVNTFGANASFVTQNVSPNLAQQLIGSFVLQTGSAEGVAINNVVVGLPSGATNTLVANHNLTNLTVKNGSTTLGTPIGNPVAGDNNYSVNLPVGVSSSVQFDVYADIGSAPNGQTATPWMGITYRGQVSNLSTTVAEVDTVASGNAVTVSIPTIHYNNITTVDPTLTAQFVTGNGVSSQPVQVVTFNVKTNNQVGGAVLKDLTFTSTTTPQIAQVIVNGKTANVDGSTHKAIIYGANISVPSGSSGVNVPVSVVFTRVGTGYAGQSNQTAQLSLTQVTFNDGTTIQCVGASCATPTTAISAASNALTLVGSVPSISMANSSSSLLVGAQQIGTFTISAGSTGDIKVEKIPVSVNLSSSGLTINASSIILKNATGGTLSNAPAALSASGTFDMSANPTTISAGNSVTYTVWATTAGTLGSAGSSSLSFALGAQGSFNWTDVAAGVTGITGTPIANYPTATQTRSN